MTGFKKTLGHFQTKCTFQGDGHTHAQSTQSTLYTRDSIIAAKILLYKQLKKNTLGIQPIVISCVLGSSVCYFDKATCTQT